MQRPITRKSAPETLQLKDSLVGKKLRGAEGEHIEKSLQMILGENTNPSSHLIGATDEKETSSHVDEIPRASCKPIKKAAIQSKFANH